MTNNELRIGALVENPRMPQWGPGRVACIRGPYADIFFRDVGDQESKTLKWSDLQLAQTDHDELLENLPAFIEKEGKLIIPGKKSTVEQARHTFLNRFPGGFHDPTYLDDRGERANKWRAHERFAQHFGPGNWSNTIDQIDPSTLASTIRQVIGDADDLLGATENIAFAEGLKDKRAAKRYLTTLFELLDSGPAESAFNAHAEAVAALLQSAATLTDTWTIVTLLPFLARPDAFTFVKPKNTKTAAARLAFEIHYDSTPNWVTYEAVLRMTNAYMQKLNDLQPRDFIDVQSFFWVTVAPKGKPRAASRAKR